MNNTKVSLRQRRNKILGKNGKKPIFIRVWSDTKKLLCKTGKSSLYTAVIAMSVILPVIGAMISIAANNIYLLPVAVVIGVYTPPLLILSRKGSLIRGLNDAVNHAVGVISNTYIETEDIVMSFKDNLAMLKEPVKTPCYEFVAEASYLQANIPMALGHLKEKVESDPFHEWCDILVGCAENKDLKYVLPVISDKINDMTHVQAELDTVLEHESVQFREITVISILLCAAMPLLQPVWWQDLISNAIGKITVTIAVLIIFFAWAAKVRITRPIYERR